MAVARRVRRLAQRVWVGLVELLVRAQYGIGVVPNRSAEVVCELLYLEALAADALDPVLRLPEVAGAFGLLAELRDLEQVFELVEALALRSQPVEVEWASALLELETVPVVVLVLVAVTAEEVVLARTFGAVLVGASEPKVVGEVFSVSR